VRRGGIEEVHILVCICLNLCVHVLTFLCVSRMTMVMVMRNNSVVGDSTDEGFMSAVGG
jgi:hypothetical protein